MFIDDDIRLDKEGLDQTFFYFSFFYKHSHAQNFTLPSMGLCRVILGCSADIVVCRAMSPSIYHVRVLYTNLQRFLSAVCLVCGLHMLTLLTVPVSVRAVRWCCQQYCCCI